MRAETPAPPVPFVTTEFVVEGAVPLDAIAIEGPPAPFPLTPAGPPSPPFPPCCAFPRAAPPPPPGIGPVGLPDAPPAPPVLLSMVLESTETGLSNARRPMLAPPPLPSAPERPGQPPAPPAPPAM